MKISRKSALAFSHGEKLVQQCIYAWQIWLVIIGLDKGLEPILSQAII